VPLIAFRDVAIASDRGTTALSGMTFQFRGGRVSAVGGSTAAARRLLLHAMLGLRPVQQGAIMIDGLNPASQSFTIRQRVCVVPVGVPVRPHLRPVDHVRLLLSVSGHPLPSRAQIVTALRMTDLADSRLAQRGWALAWFERLCVWLAVHHLRHSPVLIIHDLTAELLASRTAEIASLLSQASSDDQAVLMTTPDPDVARALAHETFRFTGPTLVTDRDHRGTLVFGSPAGV